MEALLFIALLIPCVLIVLGLLWLLHWIEQWHNEQAIQESQDSVKVTKKNLKEWRR